jgi:hypothetical protein
LRLKGYQYQFLIGCQILEPLYNAIADKERTTTDVPERRLALDTGRISGSRPIAQQFIGPFDPTLRKNEAGSIAKAKVRACAK